MLFQMRLPAVVRSTNLGSGIRSTPAGSEMRLRKIGIMRPKNTAMLPCLWNQASVRSTSSSLTSGSQPMIRRVRSRPTIAPT